MDIRSIIEASEGSVAGERGLVADRAGVDKVVCDIAHEPIAIMVECFRLKIIHGEHTALSHIYNDN